MLPRLVFNSWWSFCHSLLCAGITGVHQYTCLRSLSLFCSARDQNRPLLVPGKCSITEPHPWPILIFCSLMKLLSVIISIFFCKLYVVSVGMLSWTLYFCFRNTYKLAICQNQIVYKDLHRMTNAKTERMFLPIWLSITITHVSSVNCLTSDTVHCCESSLSEN